MTSRIAELRRRVLADPASIAFAQLAEEYRRTGAWQEAIACCRDGLLRHPDYLSARLTLGRALLESGALDEAAHELGLVLQASPDNLAATRAIAEVHHRRGALDQALDAYKRALALVRFDPQLEETIARIERESSGGSQVAQYEAEVPRGVTDFDALLAALGQPGAEPPPATDVLISGGAPVVACEPLASEPPTEPGGEDLFARLEHRLRSVTGRPAPSADDRVLGDLEAWLRVLTSRTGQDRR